MPTIEREETKKIRLAIVRSKRLDTFDRRNTVLAGRKQVYNRRSSHGNWNHTKVNE